MSTPYSRYVEAKTFASAINKLKQKHNLIITRGYFEKGKMFVIGIDTLRKRKRFEVVPTDIVEVNELW